MFVQGKKEAMSNGLDNTRMMKGSAFGGAIRRRMAGGSMMHGNILESSRET